MIGSWQESGGCPGTSLQMLRQHQLCHLYRGAGFSGFRGGIHSLHIWEGWMWNVDTSRKRRRISWTSMIWSKRRCLLKCWGVGAAFDASVPFTPRSSNMKTEKSLKIAKENQPNFIFGDSMFFLTYSINKLGTIEAWSTCSFKGRGRLVAVAPPGPFHNSSGHFRQPGGEMAPWRRQWVKLGSQGVGFCRGPMDFEKTTTETQLNFRKLHWNADFCWIFFYWNNDYLRKELIEVEPRGPLVYLSFEDGSLCLSTIPKSNSSMVTQQWATCFKWCNRSHFASNFLNLSFPKV